MQVKVAVSGWTSYSRKPTGRLQTGGDQTQSFRGTGFQSPADSPGAALRSTFPPPFPWRRSSGRRPGSSRWRRRRPAPSAPPRLRGAGTDGQTETPSVSSSWVVLFLRSEVKFPAGASHSQCKNAGTHTPITIIIIIIILGIIVVLHYCSDVLLLQDGFRNPGEFN